MSFRAVVTAMGLAFLSMALGTSELAAHVELPRGAKSDRITLPPVSVAGAPRTLVTLVVAVPAELEGASRIDFAVEVSGRVDVLGRLDGEVRLVPGERARPVMLTLRVPHDALVGLLDVADVIFRGDNGREVVVPIILRVPAVLSIRISGDRELVNLAGGDRLELAYRVQNLGNAVEVFDVEVGAPQEWTLRDRVPRTVAVAAYGIAELALGMRVPPFAPGGDVPLTVSLRRRGSADTAVVASARTMLRVRNEEPRAPGIALDPTLTFVSSAAGTAMGTALRIAGPISKDIRVRAQFSPTRPSAEQSLALSAAGAYTLPFQASVSTRDWNVDVGTAQLTLPEVAGASVVGRGAAMRLETDAREISAIVAQPARRQGSGGGLVGASAAFETVVGRLGGSFASLDEGGSAALGGRQLTAFGADWTSNSFGAYVVSAGAAIREYGEGATLGFRLQGIRETDRDMVRARLVHSPGGSRAFAVAADQFQLEARRDLTERLVVTFDATSTSDANAVFSSITGRSLSAGPRFRLTDRSTISARFIYSSVEARAALGGLGGFGTRSTGVTATYSTSLGQWRISSDVQSSAVTREATLLSGAADQHTALQNAVNGVVTRDLLALGQLALGASVSQAGAGSGLPLATTSSFVRWTAIPLVLGGQVIRAETEARVYSAASEAARVAYRIGLSTRFISGLDLSASVSRSPFVQTADGRSGLLAAIQLTTSADIFSSNRLITPGVVFIDRDGDGKQGPGEEGVQGVGLRFANVRVTTNRRGEYRLPADLRGRVRVDPATLPRGFVAHPRLVLDSLEQRYIPLVATGSKEIELVIEPDPDGRAPDVDLSQASIWLLDRDGFEWMGRSVGGGKFAFEHVPAGDYTLRFNFDRLSETVRTDEVRVQIRAGVNEIQQVNVRGRTIRFITPPERGGRSGGARSGGTRIGFGRTP